MALFFEITNGELLGKRFLLTAGLKIGRHQGEIQLNDAKSSSLHAAIEEDANGVLQIRDLKSTNGIKINGLSTKYGPLLPGVIVQIGRTFLLVVEGDNPIGTSKPKDDGKAKLTKKGPSNEWHNQIGRLLADLPLQNRPGDPELRPFLSAVQLHFIEGIQSETLFTLGYGPRKAGTETLDLLLLDEDAPVDAFQISPDENGEPLFYTQHPRVVLVNDEGLERRTLYAGDLIRVGKTLIRVDFV